MESPSAADGVHEFSAFTLKPLGVSASGVITALTYVEVPPPSRRGGRDDGSALWFNIYAGTAGGKLDMFKVRSVLGAGDERIVESCTVEHAGKVVSKRRKPVRQLQAIDHCGHLVVLCADKLLLYDLATLADTKQGKALQRIGATSLFCSELGGPPLFRLAAASKKKLTLFEFSRGEYMVKKEIALSDKPRQLVWHDDHICVAYAKEYNVIHATTGAVEQIPIALSGGVTPIVTLTPDEELLVTGPSNIGIRLKKSCNLANKGAIPWSESPTALGCSFPYILALLGDERLVVHFDETSGGQSRLVQTIALDWPRRGGGAPILVDGSACAGADDASLAIAFGGGGSGKKGSSSARGGRRGGPSRSGASAASRRARVLADPRRPVLAARGTTIAWLLPTPFTNQIDSLIDALLIDQAVDLCKCVCEAGSDSKEQRDRRLSSFHSHAAVALFRAARFAEAVHHWKECLRFQRAVLTNMPAGASGAGAAPRSRARSDAGEFAFEPFDVRELIAFFPDLVAQSVVAFRPKVLTSRALAVEAQGALTIEVLLDARVRTEGAGGVARAELAADRDAALTSARIGLCELLTWAIEQGLASLLPAPLPANFGEVVYTAFVKVHVTLARYAELRDALNASGGAAAVATMCSLEECVSCLEERALFHLAALMLYRHGEETWARALRIWERLGMSADVDAGAGAGDAEDDDGSPLIDASECFAPSDACAATVALLAQVARGSRAEKFVWRFAPWAVAQSPESALRIFIERRGAASLAPMKVLTLLEDSLEGRAMRAASVRFLGWCVRSAAAAGGGGGAASEMETAALRRTLRTELAVHLVQARLHGDDDIVVRLADAWESEVVVEGEGLAASASQQLLSSASAAALAPPAERATTVVGLREERMRARAFAFDFLADDEEELNAVAVLAVVDAHLQEGGKSTPSSSSSASGASSGGEAEETLLRERVELLGRCSPPRHEAALRILVHETNDFAMVERYCVRAQTRSEARRKRRRQEKPSETEATEGENAFLVLLRMLFVVEDDAAQRGRLSESGSGSSGATLPPQLPRMLSSSRALVERALELLVRHSESIDPIEVLAVLPDDFALYVCAEE